MSDPQADDPYGHTGASAVDSALLGPMFGAEPMRAAFSDRARLQAMLDVEAALARAEAACGIIPAPAAEAIAAACDASAYDVAGIGRQTPLGGNAAIPLVKALTAAVAEDARGFVHWGATSQDIIDTGLMLQLRRGLELLEADLAAIAAAAARLAEAHRGTSMPGRTFLQHALPIPFGLKAAVWLGLAARAGARLARARRELLFVQFGGAAGTLASLGSDGVAVMEGLGRELDLAVPDMPWHSARDRLAEIAAAAAIAAGAMAKIAADVTLLMQTDTAEAFEPSAPGKGGSSTMPHKRNPVGAIAATAAAMQAEARLPLIVAGLRHEQERAIGAWHAEWAAMSELFVLTSGAVGAIRTVLEGLTVDAARMRQNLDATQGLVFAEAAMMALAPAIGRGEAHHRIEMASKAAVASGRHLRDVLAEDKTIADALGPDGLDRLFEPANYQGVADEFITRALDAWRSTTGERESS